MFKLLLSLVLVGSIVSLTGGRLALVTNGKTRQAAFADKVKAEIANLGTGPSVLVEVKLHNNVKLRGYIKEATADRFIVVDDKTGAATEVFYPQVKQVKGHNLSTGAKVAIGIGIGLVILLLILKDRITGS